MDPYAIRTRDDALALVEADLITIRDFTALCGFRGWAPLGDAVGAIPVPQAGRRDPRDARSHAGAMARDAVRRGASQGASQGTSQGASQLSPQPRLVAAASRSEPGAPIRDPFFGLSLTTA